MTVRNCPAVSRLIRCPALLAGICIMAASALVGEEPRAIADGSQMGVASSLGSPSCEPIRIDSPYIPVDSWVYPALWRLYALGYIDTIYLGMRPYTRASVDHMLEEAAARITDAGNEAAADEAQGIYESLQHALHFDASAPCGSDKPATRVESVYSVERAIGGTPLRDSFHLGSTIINDYGRPYEKGFNDYTGASGYATAGRFQLYARGEFQGAPSSNGYSTGLGQALAQIDFTQYFFNPTCYLNGTTCVPVRLNQLSTIPVGPIGEYRQLAHYGSLCFGELPESRNFVWQAGRLAGTRPRSGHGLLQQRRKHLFVPHQSHRTAAYSRALLHHRTVSI
jgi:hypothetical protein